ncbi:hypothetical protein BH23GEM9_BH23GEM9_18280 [soil metagenome]
MLGRLFGTRIAPAVEVSSARAHVTAGELLTKDLPRGVVLRAGRWVPVLGGWLSGHRRAAAAVTLGRTIVVHPDVKLTRRLLRHELAHVRQWQQRPFTFPLHYVWLHLRHGYRANPYEVEARAAESTES